MKIFTIMICIFLAVHVYAQERTVTGILTDDTNEPLPGVNVTIKGTGKGTVTDAEGRYSIVAPIGSIVVFSFIGMQTREALVTTHGLSAVKRNIPSPELIQPGFTASWANLPGDTTGRNKPGVAVIDSRTGKILNKSSITADQIIKIRKLGNNIHLHSRYPDNTRRILNFQFSTTIGFESVNRWPALQSIYAQGRPSGGELVWHGPDDREIFSYGPLLRTLSVPSYDPRSYFNNIVASTTQFSTGIRLQQQSTFHASYERTDRNGIIPGSWASVDNLSLRLKEFPVSNKIKISASTNMQASSGKLLQHGSNLSNVIYSVYRTPPTHDNLSEVSHASGLADNPYDLGANLPDNDRGRRATSLLSLKYNITDAVKLNLSTSYDHQSSKVVNGFIPGGTQMAAGRITHRYTRQGFFHGTASLDYEGSHNWDETLRFIYRIENQNYRINRTDGFGYALDSFNENAGPDSLLSINNKILRTSHEVAVVGSLSKYYWVTIKFANRAYFSNTASPGSYLNLFPSASIEYNLGEHIDIDRLAPYAMISRNINEAPLTWSSWAHTSTRQTMQSAMSTYESGELFFNRNLAPETDVKFETGVKARFWGGLNIEGGYYNTTTANMIAPTWQGDRFELSNAAKVNTYGWLADISRSFYFYPNIQLDVAVNWSKYNSVVRKLNSGTGYIPLAGFNEAAAVLAEGQPAGAIYGTSYLRNNNGTTVIDNNGFPIVDSRVKMIGNPIPNWIGGTSISVSFRGRYKLWTVLDYRAGGDRWNGTNRALDYLGISQTSADQRSIGNYVFDGVDAGGKPNATPVMFADPAGNINDNRWVRDGYAGAAEEYIEKASWVRMGTLGLSYSTYTPGSICIKWIQVSLVAKNLFLLTKYHGADPSTALFGYSNGSGLDFFNMPAMKSFYGSVSIKF